MPVPNRQEVLTGLFAAWRMLLRDARAIGLFDATPAGFWKSFFCAAVVLPAYLLVVILDQASAPVAASLGRLVLVEAITYVIVWTVWPVLMAQIVPLLDRRERYIRYVVAYNWASGPQTLIMLAAVLLAFADLFPAVLGVAVLALILVYQTFIARVALDIGLFQATALALSEFFLGRIVYAARTLLLQ